jgi:hypothetical protein
MTEATIIRARIAELTKMLADLQARLRIMEIEKQLFALQQAKEGATIQ